MSIRSDVVFHPFTSDLIRRKATQLCRRSDFSRSDEEDLRQDMVMYLWTKARLFDAARGNIEAFVTTAIGSWVGMELRRRRAGKRSGGFKALSLEGTLVECDGELDSLADMIGDADGQRRNGIEAKNLLDEIEIREAFREANDSLTTRERALLREIIDHGVAGAARLRRVSRRQIDRALAAIRERITGKRADGGPTA
jgi:DNA-directed RNA polymerase specialized sigma24 family protein